MSATRCATACVPWHFLAAMSATLAATLAASLSTVAPASADTTIAQVSAPTPVSAYGGRAVWSTWNPATNDYRLTAWSGGLTATVPVAPRRVAFDARLGPDPSGATVATYSRCARESISLVDDLPAWQQGRGCDLYEFDFATGRERKLATVSSPDASESMPSMAGDRIAFARTAPGSTAPSIYVGSVTAKGPVRRLRGGPRRSCVTYRRRRQCHTHSDVAVTSLSVEGPRVAFVWSYRSLPFVFPGEPGSDSKFQAHELWLETMGGVRTRVDVVSSSAMVDHVLLAPGLGPRSLDYIETCDGDPGGCTRTRYAFKRYDMASRRRSATAGLAGLLSVARDRGRVFYVQLEDAGGAGYNNGTCGVDRTASSCTIAMRTDPPEHGR
jgi:hypothetical protein